MYGAAASCKDIAWASVTNWEPHCVTHRILLCPEAWDESSARNSVSYQSLATIWHYGMQ